MNLTKLTALSAAGLIAVATTASAAPLTMTPRDSIAPRQHVELVRYRHYRHHGRGPGAAVAGTALGLLGFGLAAADGCGYYGDCYGGPDYGYGGGYYGRGWRGRRGWTAHYGGFHGHGFHGGMHGGSHGHR